MTNIEFTTSTTKSLLVGACEDFPCCGHGDPNLCPHRG